ncbi:GNAT family N-acetyltransferase [Actinoplanes sp. NPDC026670]|uniref:GNAT family N-acetyltransferase n=1 Tax=Actinoplanes sp. NPDC026670 TaxID=3154700 RepID=UPI0034099273
MDIRTATTGDIPAIVEIGRLTWPPTYAFAGADYIAHGLASWWSPEAVARSLDTTTVLVASGASGPVATGNIDMRGETPIIWKLYVLPAAQRSGAGSALLEALISYAPSSPVRLSHLDGNTPAARFYAAHGFTELRREPATRPGWPDSIWLERPPT